MSSIIVLDSSDENEVLPKKPNSQLTSSSVDFGNASNSSNCKSTIRSKQRNLPSGIRIKPHNSHGTIATKSQTSSSMQLSDTSSVLGTNIYHAITNQINNECQNPPKQPVLTQRKRKSTSPSSSIQLAPKSFEYMDAAATTFTRNALQLTPKPTVIVDLTSTPDKSSYTSVSLNETPIIHRPNGVCGIQLNVECGKEKNVQPAESPKNEHKTKPLAKLPFEPELIEVCRKADPSPKQKTKPHSKLPTEPEFDELIEVCRKADPSADMNKIIKTKLVKYYYEVHGNFVKSKSFRKSLRKVSAAIRAEPDLVYYNLSTIVEELKIRRKAKVTDAQQTTSCNEITDISIEVNEQKVSAIDEKLPQSTIEPESTRLSTILPLSSTENKKLNKQIKKLNKALYVLTKRIKMLEQSEVDWDDEDDEDDSSFLRVERFKKRACQIYEKICDLTGESKDARRLIKKPIRFNETRIPQFNKTLQAFINRTKEFPDYYDVLRMLEHCNRTYSLGYVNFELKNIAEDAFMKVGKILQSRRKADLYETVSYYGREKDPADSDPILAAKLNENKKNSRKIEHILEKYARKQDMPAEDNDEDNRAENTNVINSVKAMESASIDFKDCYSIKSLLPQNFPMSELNKLKWKENSGGPLVASQIK